MVAYFRGAIDERHDIPGNWYNDSPGGAPLTEIPAVGNLDDEIVFDENGLVDCIVQADWAVRSVTLRAGYANTFNANGYNFEYGYSGFYAVGAIGATVRQGTGTWTHGGSFRVDADMLWYEDTAANIFIGGLPSPQQHRINLPYRGGGPGSGAVQLRDVTFAAGSHWRNDADMQVQGTFLGEAGTFDPNGKLIAVAGNCTWASGFAFGADPDAMNGCTWVVGGDFNCYGQVLNATAFWYLQVDGAAVAASVGSVEYCDASGFTEVQAAVGWTEDENTLNWAVPKSYTDAVVVVAAGVVVPVDALTAFDASVIVANATVTISDEFEEVLPCGASPPNPPETEELFPAGSAPTNRIPTLSALCSYGPTQLVMQGALRQVLVQHFADPRNILNATLRNKLERDGVWSPDADTGIYIESLHRWRPELTESRPGIILKEGEWRWQRMGIADRGGVEWRSGKQHFGGIWKGTHTFFAVDNHGAEAQILAWEVAKVMLWFASELAQKLELHRFVPGSIGKVSVITQEATENYVVPVSVAYAAFETWYTQEEAPRLKRVVFRASEVLGYY
jgi:hypothetical protein